MNPSNNLPSSLKNDKHININIQPGMVNLSRTTPSSLSSTLQSHQPSFLLTPKSSMLVSRPPSRIVTFRIPTSKSSISYSVPIMLRPRIGLATWKETDEPSK